MANTDITGIHFNELDSEGEDYRLTTAPQVVNSSGTTSVSILVAVGFDSRDPSNSV